MDRNDARARAMQLVYEWEMGGEGGEDTRQLIREWAAGGEDARPGSLTQAPYESEAAFMNTLASGAIQRADEIDERLSRFLRGWTIERLSRVDLAILRIATYEIIWAKTADAIVIDEAVELAKAYSTEKAGGFINGVLGSLVRDLREEDAE